MARSEEKKVSVIFTVKNDEFNRNLNNTKQQINLTSKELQTASAKINLYGANLQTLGQKHALLTSQIQNVNDKMNQYKASLEANTTKLNSNKLALEQLGSKKKELTTEVKQAIKTYGEESTEVLKLKERLNQCSNEYTEMNNRVNSNVKSLNSSQKQMAQSEAELLKYQTELKNTNKAISEQANGFINASKSFNSASETLKKTGGTISDVGGSIMTLSAPFAIASGLAVKASVDFESAFTGVRKTVEATEEQFTEIKNGILDMSKVMPESANAIAKVSESAGQLGIETENVLGFTKTMVMLGDSTNLSSEEASIALAKLANITQMPQTKFQNLGSSVVALGNNLATTEQDIAEMSLRLAGAGRQVGLTEAEILGLAGALSSVGVEAEMGGSAFSKVMVQMQLASELGTKANEVISQTGYSLRELQLMASLDGKGFKGVAENLSLTTEELHKFMSASSDLESFSKVTNKTAEEFKTAFKDNASGAIIEFITGLQNCEKQGVSAIAVLDDMGITEVRMRDALLRASGAGDAFSNSIKISTKAWEENVALTEEADKRYATTASKVEMLKNKFKAVGIELGENLLPFVIELMDGLSDLVEWFGDLDEGTQKMILQIGLVTFATGGLLKVVGSVTKSIGTLSGGVGSVLKFFGSFSKGAKEATIAGEALASGVSASGTAFSVFSGIALPLIGVMAVLATGLYAIHEVNDVVATSISTTTEEMSLMEQAMAKLMGTQRYSKEELQDMGIMYHDYNDNVAPKTVETLDNLAEKFRNLQIEIDRISLKDTITEEDNAELIKKTEDLCNNIIQKIKEKQNESNEELRKLFNIDGVTDEAEQKILDDMMGTGNEAIQKVQDITNQINQIIKDGGNKTVEGQKQIDDLMKQEQDIAFQNVINSQDKTTNAESVFREKISTLSLDATRKLLEEEATVRDENVKKIHDDYDAGIGILREKILKATGEKKEAYQSELDKNLEVRDKLLKAENDKWNGYLNIIDAKAPEVYANINKYNGQELSEKDIQNQKMLEKLKSHFDNINKITESGNYMMYDNTSNSLRNISVTVDERTKEVTGIYDRFDGTMGTYSEDIKGSLQSVADQSTTTTDTIKIALNDMSNNTINASGQMVNANGDIIGSLQKVKDTGNGTREGILNLNGTPISIQSNADGVITNMEEVKDKVEEIPGYKRVTIATIFEAIGEGVKSLFGYETGTSNVGESGIYNVNERGMELFDSISGSQNFSLSVMNSGYDSAYLSSGTKVTNALMTTAKMNRMIDTGIQDNTTKAINSLASGIALEIGNAFDNIQTSNKQGNIVNEIHLYIGNKELTNELADGVINRIDRQQRDRKVW